MTHDDGSRWRRGGPWPSSLVYAVYQQSIFVVVCKTMLGFQLLSLDLICSNGTLVARPVEVDDRTGVIDDRVIGIKTLSCHRVKLLVTVTTCSELVFRDNAIRAPIAVLIDPSVPVKSTAAKNDVAIFIFLTSFLCILTTDIATFIPSRGILP